MVAARTGAPSPADPRVACPACGGLVHPIAGKCKHCKTDLVSLRAPAGMPIASTPLAPRQLGGFQAPMAAMAPMARGAQPIQAVGPVTSWGGPHPLAGPNGHNAIGMPGAQLPPLPPLPMSAAASGHVARASTWSRRWPIVVVILAAAAIAVSIFLLVKGNDKPKSSKVKRTDVPIGDSGMNTDPLVPHAGITPDPNTPDPWGQPPQLPNDPADPPPSQQGGTNPFGLSAGAPPKEKFYKAMYTTVCDRLKNTCNAPSSVTDTMCSQQIMDAFDQYGATNCGHYDQTKAAACISKLAQFPCLTNGTWDSSQVSNLFYGIDECTSACSP